MDMNIAAGESWLVRLCKAVEELGDATYLASVEVGEGELVVKMICSICSESASGCLDGIWQRSEGWMGSCTCD